MLALLLAALVAAEDPLGSPEGYLKYDVKKGASLRPDYEAVGYWNGSVWGWEEAAGGRVDYTKLFLFEGVNVRSVQEDGAGGYVSLSREVSVYRDPATGDILRAWTSAFSGRDNEVFEVANDPVNALLEPYVGQHSYSAHHTSFTGDFWLDYPNPLPPAIYPSFSSGPRYRGGELFLTFTRTAELLEPARTEVGYVGSWARAGPWLPWMERGDAHGGLLYSAPFLKLPSVEALPGDLLLWMVENYPEFLHPPRNYTVPNMTSWRVFKAIVDRRRAAGEPDIQVPEQPEWSAPRPPGLDPALLARLADLGQLDLQFEGSLYRLADGAAGEALLWQEGGLALRLAAGRLHLGLDGWYGTPWPAREPLSGGAWTNPEGAEVEVPRLAADISFPVDTSTCSSMAVTSDSWEYGVLSCEVVEGPSLLLVTLYLGRGPAGEEEVVGGVAARGPLPAWLALPADTGLQRWLFKAPPME